MALITSVRIKLIIACLVQRIEGTVKMHLINFKELTSQELVALVDLGIEVKHNPKKYLKTFTGQVRRIDFPERPPLAPGFHLKLP